jgi:hypothetical protein
MATLSVPAGVRDLQAPDGSSEALLAVFLVLGLASAAYAVILAVRRRDPLPVLMIAGAGVAVFNEATFDVLGHIWYPVNVHPRAFTMLDRPIPLSLVFGYLPFLGLLPVLIARAIDEGVARSRLWALALGIAGANLAIDILGTQLGTWSYYGDWPLKYIAGSPLVAAAPFAIAGLLAATRSRLTGPRRALVVLIPATGLGATFAGAGWPAFAAMNIAGTPLIVQVAAGVVTLILSASIIHVVSSPHR